MANIAFNIFRGYDIRGKVPGELNENVVRLIAKAYATLLSRRQITETVLMHDNRLTAEEFKKYSIEELLNAGIDVIDNGLGLSQIMYFSQYHYLSKGGVMITASHNPKEYNGFKLAMGFSDTLVTEEINEVIDIIKKDAFAKTNRQAKLKTEDVFPFYLSDLKKRISLKRKFKIVVDACNGATGKFLPAIFRSFNSEVIEQNCNLDGNFPSGTADPTEKAVMERLAKRVVVEKADLGFAYDVDGDRIGIVDETGRFTWNDVLVALFAKDILSYMKGAKIIFNTLCSKATSDTIEKSGGVPVIWLTGHSFIKAKLKEERAPFGGELSGHFFFMDNFYGHDDGAYTSLRLLQFLDRKKMSLAQAIDELPKYFSSPEIKLGLPDAIKFEFINTKITTEFKTLFGPTAKYLNIDGIRADTKEEMAIIRASQNGPYITIKFEAKTKDKYEALRKAISKILHSHSEIDFSTGVNTQEIS
jgi:phosphomannomutase/phosphoglucomutase